ncbi:Sm-like ribonucleo protein [Fragilariopsis cylindrus CCMP1102]|uniref:U6 snRNA-associated Sm-like protein LSm4 n=1 Tax=Fragilariopsis cylindrus CCMP1102 TaxID=635003 RepID=A0A1E7EIH0_9STRA|nr:Sm-like ribonucleo protein [Fragilariopsis cylindrus CCMP1102]|eukprot:OEU05687.1 Sm-like ribonucleo protein [Fragilariopsis cylindrus CCMP1102]
MLPLSLLNVAAESSTPLLVELKGGDTYNGRLVSCDSWMNMNLSDVVCTSKHGDKFWKLPSCYIRGSAIKYLRLPPDLLDTAKEKVEEDERRNKIQREQNYGGRGRGGRGRGRGRGRSDGGRGRGGRGRSDGGRGGGRGRSGGDTSSYGGRGGGRGGGGRDSGRGN